MTGCSGRIVLVLALAAAMPGCGSAPDTESSGAGEAAPPAPAASDSSLPVLGDVIAEYPAGEGQGTAERSCGSCHSSDIVRQQRLTEAQWTASVEKMIRWGAVVPDPDKTALVSYLARHYGPGNASFTPVVTRPVGE